MVNIHGPVRMNPIALIISSCYRLITMLFVEHIQVPQRKKLKLISSLNCHFVSTSLFCLKLRHVSCLRGVVIVPNQSVMTNLSVSSRSFLLFRPFLTTNLLLAQLCFHPVKQLPMSTSPSLFEPLKHKWDVQLFRGFRGTRLGKPLKVVHSMTCWV